MKNSLLLIAVMVLICGCGSQKAEENTSTATITEIEKNVDGESLSTISSQDADSDGLENFVPRDSDCICVDHCTIESLNPDCPVCRSATAENLDSICWGAYPELYTEDSAEGPQVYFAHCEEIYAPDFLPVEVWEAIPNSLPLYLKSMNLTDANELHALPESIVNTDSEKSFVFTMDAYPETQIKVSYKNGKLDYTMSIGGGAE